MSNMEPRTQEVMHSIAPDIAELLKTVREYESDTFSAQGEELTNDEAVAITIELIGFAIRQLSELNELDGIRLSEELENIRD